MLRPAATAVADRRRGVTQVRTIEHDQPVLEGGEVLRHPRTGRRGKPMPRDDREATGAQYLLGRVPGLQSEEGLHGENEYEAGRWVPGLRRVRPAGDSIVSAV